MKTPRLLALAVVLCAGLLTIGTIVDARERAPSVLVRYREALRAWFPFESAARLDAVDLAPSRSLPPGPAGIAVAGHAARRFAPLALEAVGKNALAGRLRRLAPVTDMASVQAARGALALTIDALEQSPWTRRDPHTLAALASVEAAQRSILYAVELGRTCVEPRRPGRAQRAATRGPDACLAIAGEAMDNAARAGGLAVDAGAPLPHVVDACILSLRREAPFVPARRRP